jgi:hypothetical protein
MVAYLLADIGNGEMDEHTQAEIMAYLKDCFRVNAQYFSKIVLIPSAIPFVERQYKAANNDPLIFKLHTQMLGMLSFLNSPYRELPKELLEISDRVKFVENFWRR